MSLGLNSNTSLDCLSRLLNRISSSRHFLLLLHIIWFWRSNSCIRHLVADRILYILLRSWIWTKISMNMELYVVVSLIIKESAVEHVGNLRDLSWRVHQRHLQTYPYVVIIRIIVLICNYWRLSSSVENLGTWGVLVYIEGRTNHFLHFVDFIQ